MTATETRQVCTRCVMDTSDPDINFDADGVCNHCRRADLILPTVRWSATESQSALAGLAKKIQSAAKGRPYDSIVGLSGGVDSSYAAYLGHKIGLRPLAVHFDNGWDSEVAVDNIKRIVEGCGLDLITYVIDWREFRDLQRAFLRASVLDIELITDHAIVAATANLAQQHKIRYLLTGYNIATEHGLPRAWHWAKYDWTNIRAIHGRFGSIPLRTFPHMSALRWNLILELGLGVRPVPLLDYVNYRRRDAMQTLANEFGWRDYGGKHHESLFTKFYQGEILPTKFGIDKRRLHLSDLIRNGELTRGDALAIVAEPTYEPDELRVESEYVRKKLGFDETEWAEILEAPPRSHSEFPSDKPLMEALRGPYRLARSLARRIKRQTRDRRRAPSESRSSGS